MARSPFYPNRDYEKFRQVLLSIFLYGSSSKTDLVSLRGKSRSTLEKNIQQLERMVGKYVSRRGRKYSSSLSYFEDSRNVLCRTFRTKSTTVHRMNMFLHILAVLARNSGMFAAEVCDAVNLFSAASDTDFQPTRDYNEKTLTPFLNELCDEGLLTRVMEKNAFRYHLSEACGLDLTEAEYVEFYHGVSVLAKILYPYAAGESVAEYLKHYGWISRGLALKEPECMLYSFREYHATVHDEKIWTLFAAMEDEREVQIAYQPRGVNEAITQMVAPVRIIYQLKYGRVYLVACLSNDGEKFCYFRLDRIQRVELTETPYPRRRYVEQYTNRSACMWEIGMLPEGRQLTTVEIHFDLSDASRREYLAGRIEREKKHGVVTKLSPTLWHMRINVTDPQEFKPWIKSFGDAARVLPSEEHDLDEVIRQEFLEVLTKYEHVQ